MKLLKKDLRHGKLSLAIQNLDDLWHLSQIIGKGDLVRGKTTRKVKATEKESSKKTITLTIQAQEVEFKDRNLRIAGITSEESEDIPKGSHHTLGVEEGSVLTITKVSWPAYMLKRIEQAGKRQAKALIMILDREEAIFAILNSQGYDVLAEIKGKVAKKGFDTITGNFYRELGEKLSEYDARFNPDSFIIASPAFWKEEFLKEFNDDGIKKKVVLAACSSVGNTAIEEVLKRPELKEVLKQQRAAEEAKYVDELMMEISKDGLSAYGRKEVEEAVATGNVKRLLVTDGFIGKARLKAEEIMKNAEAVSGEVIIINSENESGKKLDSLGGVGVLLRYAIR